MTEEAYTDKLHVAVFEEEDVRNEMKERNPESYKGDYGTVVVFGGTRGMEGAAGLTGISALRSGAGKVILAVPEHTEILYGIQPEIMVRRLKDNGEGIFNKYSIAEGLDLLDQADAVVIGCGFGRYRDSELFFREILLNFNGPMIVDADGIHFLRYLIADSMWNEIKDQWNGIITPHCGEAADLLEKEIDYVVDYRVEALEELVELTAATVVLKGHNTLTTGINQPLYFNETGNPGMATAGSGDVLSGIIGAILARRDLTMDKTAGAAIGVLIHGLSGDLAAERIGQTGLIAGDIIKYLPEAWKRVLRY